MPVAAQILAAIAAAIHVFFFYLESVAFSKPSTYKAFGVKTPQDAEAVKPMALNQGFYNLFLAMGIAVGLVLHAVDYRGLDILTIPPETPEHYWGESMIVFSLACMLGAAAVLLISSKGKLARGAAIQGLVPAAALLVIALG